MRSLTWHSAACAALSNDRAIFARASTQDPYYPEGVGGLKTKDPGTSRGRGLKGPFRWRWVPLLRVTVRCHGHVEDPLYEDATSTEPCLPSITGPPPSWACPSSAGPNPPGPVGRPSLFGTATSLQVGGVDPRHNNILG